MEKTKPNTTKSGYPAWKWSGSILKGNISKGGDKKVKSKKRISGKSYDINKQKTNQGRITPESPHGAQI